LVLLVQALDFCYNGQCVSFLKNKTNIIPNDSDKKPLTIYVAETDHSDMSYSSLLQKIAQECDQKGLKSQIFSEFPNQTDKVETQSWSSDETDSDMHNIERQLKNLRNVPGKQVHLLTTQFLDERLVAMGNLKGRADMYDQTFEDTKLNLMEKGLPQVITPSQYEERFLDQIDHPDVLESAKSRIKKMHQDDDYLPLDNPPDFYNKMIGPTTFHMKTIHQEMALDVRQKMKDDNDVIIMIAGGPHIPGLHAQLSSDFQDNQRFVIGNFSQETKDDELAMFKAGTAHSCQNAGKVIAFQIDPITKQAELPEEIMQAIERTKDLSTKPTTQSFVEKLGLKPKDNQTSVDFVQTKSQEDGRIPPR